MNAQSKHTEGPWDWYKGTKPHFQSQVYGENNGRTIAVCYDDESNANAKLISAAPELLEALKGVLQIWDDLYINQADTEEIKAWDTARAAIAKATQD